MKWKGKRALVVGAGRSGQAAARKLLALKSEVFVTDRQTEEKLVGITELGIDKRHLITGRMAEFSEVEPEILVLSPGVSPQEQLVRDAFSHKIPVWSEVELAMHDCRAMCVGITGTNGKTTTTTLIGELAKLTGRPVTVAGNIGVAMSGKVEHLETEGIVVAELSSFQLEFIDRLRVEIAIMLNITPDHLDRHGTIEKYLEAKSRIFKNQTKDDLAILNWDDPLVKSLENEMTGRVVFFSPTSFLKDGISLLDDTVVYASHGEITRILPVKDLQLRGSHNLENVMASAAAAKELGLSWEQIADGLRSFKGVEHRQEVVGVFDDILYINDSKGTNTDASEKALLAFDEPIVLIAGGKNKGLDFHPFMELVRKKVKKMILLGQAADEMAEAARDAGFENFIRADSFEDGVEKAIASAAAGDVVLLSPACTSWDMFKSYEERGELFKTLVRMHYKKPN